MKSRPSPKPSRLAPLALAAAAALLVTGCSSLGDLFAGEKVDYRSGAKRTAGLEVPPDLTQLARDGRYQAPAGVVSATGGGGTTATAGGAGAAVAPTEVGQLHIERDGQQRWLSVPIGPEELWPQLRAFWIERGFTIATEDARAGVMETDWAENRAKIPRDGVRALIGRVFEGFYDSGERDRFRTRIERSATGTEIYISHHGLQEVYTDRREEQTRWIVRPSDPQLEAEFLSRLMVRLGAPEEVARTALAAPVTRPDQARLLGASNGTAIEIDDGFDRAWRRVSVALDRAGFSVEDRNRPDGLYFVRYVDPKGGARAQTFWGRILSSSTDAAEAQRYRLQLRQAATDKSVLVVQTATGEVDQSEVARQIAKVLLAELR